MAKTADISSKRLVSLSPDAWAQWLTEDKSVVALEQLSGEFEWTSRSNDVLLKVESATEGVFLSLTEF